MMAGVNLGLCSRIICAILGKYLVLSIELNIMVNILTAIGGSSLMIFLLIRSKPGVLLVEMSAIRFLTSLVFLGIS